MSNTFTVRPTSFFEVFDSPVLVKKLNVAMSNIIHYQNKIAANEQSGLRQSNESVSCRQEIDVLLENVANIESVLSRRGYSSEQIKELHQQAVKEAHNDPSNHR